MVVTNLELERFGPFGDVDFDLCPGVNVILGANSTGKTFALKALYSVLKGLGPEARPGLSRKRRSKTSWPAFSFPMTETYAGW